MVLVHLAKGFEEVEALAVVDVLRRAEIDIAMVSITDSLEVVGAHGIQVKADKIFSDVDYDKAEMIVLPGGMPGTKNLNAHEGLKENIVKFNEANKYIAAICAAPMIIGKLNLLKGKSATCYPGFEEDLIGARLAANKVVVDGNIITSKGPGTALEFAFKIVELLKDKRTADDIKKGMIS